MQLTRFTDYATRLLLFLAVRRGETVSVKFIAEHYGISVNHLAKVAQELVTRGYLATTRGRNGGLRLERDPAGINLGELVADLEPNMAMVDCVGCPNFTGMRRAQTLGRSNTGIPRCAQQIFVCRSGLAESGDRRPVCATDRAQGLKP